MKLIIDIPEEAYQIIRDTQYLGDSGEATLENVLIRAVEKGEKQRTGHWIEHPEIKTSAPEYLMFYECSECEDQQCFCKLDIHKKHFCSNCGANMGDMVFGCDKLPIMGDPIQLNY